MENSNLKPGWKKPAPYTHFRPHETDSYLVCRLLLEKKKKKNTKTNKQHNTTQNKNNTTNNKTKTKKPK